MSIQVPIRVFTQWLFFLLLACFSFAPGFAQTAPPNQDGEEPEAKSQLHLMRRLNAHGDEFNAVVLTPDERRLVIGTEKGELIVWNIAEKQVVARLDQGSPIHSVVMLGDGRHVVAAGGPHAGSKRAGVVRCWDLNSGTSQEWRGLESDTIIELAIDRKSGLIAAGAADGRIVIWNGGSGKMTASWNLGNPAIGLAISGQSLFATTIDRQMVDDDSDNPAPNSIMAFNIEKPTDKPREVVSTKRKRFWAQLRISPDGKRLAAVSLDEEQRCLVVLLDPAKGTEIESFKAANAVWFSLEGLVLSSASNPEQVLRLKAGEKTSVENPWDSGGWHAGGDPEGLVGMAVTKDASVVWGIYKKGAAIAQWTRAEKRGEILTMTRGNVYAMDVMTSANGAGLLLTGGDDGFARFWNLADLSLRSEVRVPVGVPQGVALLAGGRQAVISCGTSEAPTEIILVDTATGTRTNLLSVDEPFVQVYAAGENFVYGQGSRVILASAGDGKTLREFTTGSQVAKFAVSANGKWLVVAEEEEITAFEIATGRRIFQSQQKADGITGIAITNDAQSIFSTEFNASLKRWDVPRGAVEELSRIHGQCHSLRLSSDERSILIGGNHRDLAIYNAATGEKLGAFDTEAADFSVTNVWMDGDRLIFTTDAGVLIDSKLEKVEKAKKR